MFDVNRNSTMYMYPHSRWATFSALPLVADLAFVGLARERFEDSRRACSALGKRQQSQLEWAPAQPVKTMLESSGVMSLSEGCWSNLHGAGPEEGGFHSLKATAGATSAPPPVDELEATGTEDCSPTCCSISTSFTVFSVIEMWNGLGDRAMWRWNRF